MNKKHDMFSFCHFKCRLVFSPSDGGECREKTPSHTIQRSQRYEPVCLLSVCLFIAWFKTSESLHMKRHCSCPNLLFSLLLT